jgi:hypothetical protein
VDVEAAVQAEPIPAVPAVQSLVEQGVALDVAMDAMDVVEGAMALALDAEADVVDVEVLVAIAVEVDVVRTVLARVMDVAVVKTDAHLHAEVVRDVVDVEVLIPAEREQYVTVVLIHAEPGAEPDAPAAAGADATTSVRPDAAILAAQRVRQHVTAPVKISALERLRRNQNNGGKAMNKCQKRIPVKVDQELASETERAYMMYGLMQSNFAELVRSGVPAAECAAYEERMLEVFRLRQECYDLIKGYAPEELKVKAISWEFIDFKDGIVEYWAV